MRLTCATRRLGEVLANTIWSQQRADSKYAHFVFRFAYLKPIVLSKFRHLVTRLLTDEEMGRGKHKHADLSAMWKINLRTLCVIIISPLWNSLLDISAARIRTVGGASTSSCHGNIVIVRQAYKRQACAYCGMHSVLDDVDQRSLFLTRGLKAAFPALYRIVAKEPFSN